MIRLADLFSLILVAGICAMVLGVPLIRLARRLGLLDIPGSAPHKTHSMPTPLAGGLILAISLGLSFLTQAQPIDRTASGILLAAAWMLGAGLLDDKIRLPPIAKLAAQFVGAAILIAGGTQVHIFKIAWIDLSLTMLWVVGIVNAFNFVDSMDGLALGIAGVAGAFFMLVTVDSGQPTLDRLSAAILGATIGTFFYNSPPAKTFLGDSGAQFLGMLLAGIGIAYHPPGLPQGVSWFTPILVLGVPIFDMSLVVVSRLRRRQALYRAGRDHTYHHLVALGLDSTRSVVCMHLTAIALGLVAFTALRASVLVANLVFVGLVIVGLAGLAALEWGQARAASSESPFVPDGTSDVRHV